MSTVSELFGANETKEIQRPSTYLKLFKTTYPVDIVFLRGNQNLNEDALQVEAGYGIDIPEGFDKIRITNGANPQTVTAFLSGGKIDYDRTVGTVQISTVAGVVSVQDYGDQYAVNFVSSSASIPLNVVAAASNVNGIKIVRAQRYDILTGPSQGMATLLAKATAPASLMDGDVLLFGGATFAVATGSLPEHAVLTRSEKAIRIAAGLRLDWYQNTVITACRTSTHYTLL